jgi:hypothetical protein
MTAVPSLTLESLREMTLAGPTEMLALLTKVAADLMASVDAKDAKQKAEAVCQKILGMLDDVEKAGKACLEGSIEKEKTTAVLAVVSQLKELVKSHLPMILCPPPFVRQVVSRVLALLFGCFSKKAGAAQMVADAVQLAGAVQVAGTASPLSSDVAAVEARLAVREPLPLAEADPAPASASAEAEAAQEKK